MKTPKRDTEFIDNVLTSKNYTKRFKKQFQKFIKTIKQIEEIELENMLLDLHINLDEQGLKTNDKDIQNSYGILIIVTQDEIAYRKNNPKICKSPIANITRNSNNNKTSTRK